MLGPKPIEVLVARAHVEGDIQLKNEAPPRIEAMAGQTIVVKFPAKFVEAGHGRETYRIRLESSMDNEEPKPVEEVFHDRPVLKDEAWITISQKIKAKNAGTHKLRYEALVEYTVGDWDGGESSEKIQSKTRSGEIMVVVTAKK